jgi:hypothetical protein
MPASKMVKYLLLGFIRIYKLRKRRDNGEHAITLVCRVTLLRGAVRGVGVMAKFSAGIPEMSYDAHIRCRY